MISVELATIDDLPHIVAIHNHSAATSNSNFSTRPTTTAERSDWFSRFSSTGPHRLLVAREGAAVLGYASSSRYRDHEAFRETVEVGISIHHEWRGEGIGTRLYAALFEHLAGEPVHVALAGIAMPNDASVAIHRKFGFFDVGVFREYATKNGGYISSLWMQRLLTPAADG